MEHKARVEEVIAMVGIDVGHAQQDVMAVIVKVGCCTAVVGCCHPKAVSRNHAVVSGFAAASVIARIFVEQILLHFLFSSGGVGASVNAP